MPKEACRIWLKITNLKVEKVHDITEEDSEKEGVILYYDEPNRGDRRYPKYKEGFISLWNSINSKRGYSWESNPWVWVIKFKRIKNK